MTFDVARIRADFPILDRQVNGHPLVYLDSANTSQKPSCVVEAMEDHYLNHNANVARAMHLLGAEATEAFEAARERPRQDREVLADDVEVGKQAVHQGLLSAYGVSRLVAGRVAEQGGQELADRLEAEGYDRYARAAV